MNLRDEQIGVAALQQLGLYRCLYLCMSSGRLAARGLTVSPRTTLICCLMVRFAQRLADYDTSALRTRYPGKDWSWSLDHFPFGFVDSFSCIIFHLMYFPFDHLCILAISKSSLLLVLAVATVCSSASSAPGGCTDAPA